MEKHPATLSVAVNDDPITPYVLNIDCEWFPPERQQPFVSVDELVEHIKKALRKELPPASTLQSMEEALNLREPFAFRVRINQTEFRCLDSGFIAVQK